MIVAYLPSLALVALASCLVVVEEDKLEASYLVVDRKAVGLVGKQEEVLVLEDKLVVDRSYLRV